MGGSAVKSKIHYGWIVCLCMCLMQAFVVTVLVNTASLFATPMAEALGVTRTSWMVWMTLYAVGCFGFSPVVGSLLQNPKVNFNVLLTAGAVCGLVALLLFAFCQGLWMAYIAAFLIGFTQDVLRTNLMSFTASQWFSGRSRGKALGYINCANGIGGVFVPLVVQMVISTAGVTAGYLVCAAMFGVFTLPFTLFVFKRSPEDKGLKPVGYELEDSSAAKAEDDIKKGVSLKRAMRTFPFWGLMIASFFFAAFGGYKNNIAGMAEEFLALEYVANAAMVGATCLSIISISDFVSNILLGWLIDKFGEFVPSLIFLICAPVFMIILLVASGTPYGFYAAALTYGLQGAWLRNSAPLIVRKIYGPKNFGKIFGYVNMFKGLMGGFSSTLFAWFYDFGGGYQGALICGLIMVLGSMALIIAAMIYARKDRLGWRSDNYTENAIGA